MTAHIPSREYLMEVFEYGAIANHMDDNPVLRFKHRPLTHFRYPADQRAWNEKHAGQDVDQFIVEYKDVPYIRLDKKRYPVRSLLARLVYGDLYRGTRTQKKDFIPPGTSPYALFNIHIPALTNPAPRQTPAPESRALVEHLGVIDEIISYCPESGRAMFLARPLHHFPSEKAQRQWNRLRSHTPIDFNQPVTIDGVSYTADDVIRHYMGEHDRRRDCNRIARPYAWDAYHPPGAFKPNGRLKRGPKPKEKDT